MSEAIGENPGTHLTAPEFFSTLKIKPQHKFHRARSGIIRIIEIPERRGGLPEAGAHRQITPATRQLEIGEIENIQRLNPEL